MKGKIEKMEYRVKLAIVAIFGTGIPGLKLSQHRDFDTNIF
jgi:hypothetical protein